MLLFDNPKAIFHGLYYTPIESHSQEQSNGIQYGHLSPLGGLQGPKTIKYAGNYITWVATP